MSDIYIYEVKRPCVCQSVKCILASKSRWQVQNLDSPLGPEILSICIKRCVSLFSHPFITFKPNIQQMLKSEVP